ncbi:MAG: hypothetical protein CMJ78_09490 [Planctomycetaceae bacterium]|nr:hypothetical protein [Planctomycetaceae bacterium]
MKTDKQLYQIFTANPDWLFELTGIVSPGHSRMLSVSLKALNQTSDGLIPPDDSTQPLTIVEFQLQPDDTIYSRTVTEMALIQQEYQMRDIRGLILFRHSSHDPDTSPWNRVVESYDFPSIMERLESDQPKRPLVAVFKPILEPDPDTLEQRTVEYFRTIRDSPLEQPVRSTLTNVFIS